MVFYLQRKLCTCFPSSVHLCLDCVEGLKAKLTTGESEIWSTSLKIPKITGTSCSSVANVIIIYLHHHRSLEVRIRITAVNLKQDFEMTAGRRVAVLKLDFSPALPSEQAHGNKVCPALRGKANRGEKSHQAAGRHAGRKHNISAYFNGFLSCFSVMLLPPFHFSPFAFWFGWNKAGTRVASLLFPPTYSFTSSPSPPAHKRWRLMNSALMHASANCIGIGNSSLYYKMFSPSRWPPAGRLPNVTLRRLPSFCETK